MLLKVHEVAPRPSVDGRVRWRPLFAPQLGNSQFLTIDDVDADGGAVIGPGVQAREEFHYTVRGTAVYAVDGAEYSAAENSAVALPAGVSVRITAGPSGWECLSTTCAGCSLWQRAAAPGVAHVRAIPFEQTTANAGPIRRRAFFSPALGNTRYVTIFHTQHDRGSPGPLHVHEVHEEAMYIAGGTFRMSVGGTDYHAEAGSILLLPPRQPLTHSAGPAGCAGVSIGCLACPLGGPAYGMDDIRELLRESHPSLHFRITPSGR